MINTLSQKLDLAEFYLEPKLYQSLSDLKVLLKTPETAMEHVYKLFQASPEIFGESGLSYQAVKRAVEQLTMADLTAPLHPQKESGKPLSFFAPSELLPLETPIVKIGMLLNIK